MPVAFIGKGDAWQENTVNQPLQLCRRRAPPQGVHQDERVAPTHGFKN
jgi:hypothetical protein